MERGEKKAAMSGNAQAAVEGSGTSIISPAHDADKRVATLKAALALKGHQVHETVTGGWLVAKWDRSHFCPHLIDLEAFARRVGVVL